jgi:hypothetical protein
MPFQLEGKTIHISGLLQHVPILEEVSAAPDIINLAPGESLKATDFRKFINKPLYSDRLQRRRVRSELGGRGRGRCALGHEGSEENQKKKAKCCLLMMFQKRVPRL